MANLLGRNKVLIAAVAVILILITSTVGSISFMFPGNMIGIIGEEAYREEAQTSQGNATNNNLAQKVLDYEPKLRAAAKKLGLDEKYIPYLMGIMMVESRGEGEDPMQSAESAGMGAGELSNIEFSIEQGVRHFKSTVDATVKNGQDVWIAVQSYNYGGGFVGFSNSNGVKKWSLEASAEFAKYQSGGQKVTYQNHISTPINGGWRYAYGNMFYVLMVQQYVTETGEIKEPTDNSTESGSTMTEIPPGYKEKINLPPYDGKNYNTSGSYPVGQCTWYVYNRIGSIGQRVDDYMGNGGVWMLKAAMLGYQMSPTPKAGYAVSFPPGVAGADPTYGHVAFVEYVNPDGSFLISEMNVVGYCMVTWRVLPASVASSCVFIAGK